MNILITSAGRRSLLIEYFMKEFKDSGKVITTDCSDLAPATYLSNKNYIVPRIDDPNYVNALLDICKKENISAIFSLIDPELSLLAKHKDDFKNIGVTVIVSPYKDCELWLDKYETLKFCRKNDFLFPKTYNSFSEFQNALENKEIEFPVFIKPQKGSASLNINKVNNLEEAKVIFNSAKNMIIQEFLNGQELGIDVYIDLVSKKIISIFIKEKISMRAGETDKAKSIKSEKLFSIVENLVSKTNLIGPIDIDVFQIGDEFYISEINPRFGGGYPLAFECGVNFPKFILNNLRGIENKPQIGIYEENIIMMKHDRIEIKKTNV
ncbi:MAG: ATP-grasp domain-containing protein [Candidatus Delongbacteria bacterium]|nr:ATP-grasp domain-containing protein [Candidatus Delongbacteria bacterium]